MFARAAFIKLKPGCEAELTRTFEQEVVPLFRREENFRGLIALILPDGKEALSLSLWDQKESAGLCCATTFGALMAWREWSWEFRWFKSRRSRIPHSTPSNE